MSGYLAKPIRYKEDFKGGVRNVKNIKKIYIYISKETAVLTQFFLSYGRDSMWSGLFTCQGT